MIVRTLRAAIANLAHSTASLISFCDTAVLRTPASGRCGGDVRRGSYDGSGVDEGLYVELGVDSDWYADVAAAPGGRYAEFEADGAWCADVAEAAGGRYSDVGAGGIWCADVSAGIVGAGAEWYGAKDGIGC